MFFFVKMQGPLSGDPAINARCTLKVLNGDAGRAFQFFRLVV